MGINDKGKKNKKETDEDGIPEDEEDEEDDEVEKGKKVITANEGLDRSYRSGKSMKDNFEDNRKTGRNMKESTP